MSDLLGTSHMSALLHAAVTRQEPVTRIKNRPEHVTGNLKVVSNLGKNSQTTIRFDATGQIVPSAKNVKKHSATADFVNLLA